MPYFLQRTQKVRQIEPFAVRLAEAVPAESVRSERKSTKLKEIGLFQCPPTSTYAFGARRMRDPNDYRKKLCRMRQSRIPTHPEIPVIV